MCVFSTKARKKKHSKLKEKLLNKEKVFLTIFMKGKFLHFIIKLFCKMFLNKKYFRKHKKGFNVFSFFII